METETKKKGNVTRWWLQLQFAFFSDKRVRALRRKHGDLALIIYQKMMLKSLENKCSMKYEKLEDTFEEEIAVDIVEDESEKISLIKNVMEFLIDHDLMMEQEDGSYFFPQAAHMSGSETDSAERMRKKRDRDRKKTSQCDGTVSPDTSTSYGDVSQCEVIKTDTNTETDLHLKSDKSKTLDVKSKTDTDHADAVPADRPAGAAATEDAAPQSDDLFSVKQLLTIAEKNKVKLTGEGIQIFHKEMQESGWMLYDKPVEKKGIVKALRGWAKYHSEFWIVLENTIHKSTEQNKEEKSSYPMDMELGIYEIAANYITKRRFDENRTSHHILIQKYCPKEDFTQEQLRYMADIWNIWPKSERYVEEDEYWNSGGERTDPKTELEMYLSKKRRQDENQ